MEKIIKQIETHYPNIKILQERERGEYQCVDVSAEHGEGVHLFDYYSEDYINRDFGVDNKFVEFCNKMDCYCEWVNPGILTIVKE